MTFFPDNDVELDDLAISHATHGLSRVVLNDGRLMDEYIFLGIISINETVATLDIEPFHSSGHFVSDDHLLLDSLGLFGLLLCLTHDGKVV